MEEGYRQNFSHEGKSSVEFGPRRILRSAKVRPSQKLSMDSA